MEDLSYRKFSPESAMKISSKISTSCSISRNWPINSSSFALFPFRKFWRASSSSSSTLSSSSSWRAGKSRKAFTWWIVPRKIDENKWINNKRQQKTKKIWRGEIITFTKAIKRKRDYRVPSKRKNGKIAFLLKKRDFQKRN